MFVLLNEVAEDNTPIAPIVINFLTVTTFYEKDGHTVLNFLNEPSGVFVEETINQISQFLAISRGR